MARPRKSPAPAEGTPEQTPAPAEGTPEQTPAPAEGTVAMVRDEPTAGGATTANVHPDEVQNWERHGWKVQE